MITLSHPTTNNNVREVALALLEAGLLETFHTCIAPCGGNFFDRISALPGLGEIRRRECHPRLRPKLRLHPWLEAIRLATRDSGRSLHVYHVYTSLDRAVARHVAGRTDVRGVYCYEDGALETFRRAKAAGAACLYDLPIAYWQTVRRLSEEERDRLPEWAPTLRSLSDSAEKLRRKDEELALADAVICPSRFVEESLPEAVRREKRIHIAPFGSPHVAGPPSADSHFRSPKLKVLFVGLMSQRKGLADLFAAMRLLDPARYELHILGTPMVSPGFYRAQGSFIYHAGRPNRQVLELMSRCHVLVLPSLAEGRSLVLQEAMACGLPVVVTRNTGGEDLVADGKAGFLVPVRDPQAIAHRLEMLGRDRDLLAAMSAAARSKAATLPWEGYRSLVIDVVHSAVSEAALGRGNHQAQPDAQSNQCEVSTPVAGILTRSSAEQETWPSQRPSPEGCMLKKRVLVYRLGSLGDTVVALPALHVVRRAFPDADLALLTNKPVATKAAPVEAILGEGFFAEVVDYPIGTRDVLKLLSVAREIRRGRYDVVVNLCAARTRLKTLRDRLFFRLSGVAHLRGFPTENSDFEPSVDQRTGLFESETERLLRRVQALGSADLNDSASWDLALTQEERTVGASGLPEGRTPVVALGVGTKMQAKDWGEENWKQLVQRLTVALPGWRLAIVGSADESRRAEGCCSVWNGPSANLCGALSPRESAALLEKVEVFVGHDSGPMHLASAVGTPCVAIFSARNLPGQWFPGRSGHKVIYHKTECFGCGLEECIVERKRCILSITVEEVLDAVMVSLRGRGLVD